MQTKYSGILPLLGLGLGGLGVSKLLRSRAPTPSRDDAFVYADKSTGELKNLIHNDDWRTVLNQWGPQDTVYHPSDEWSFERDKWEGLTQEEKNLLHRAGKPVHEWVPERVLPDAPIRFGDKIYSKGALEGKDPDFFKKLGLNEAEATEASRGNFGTRQFKWRKRQNKGFGLSDLRGSPSDR